MSLSYSIGPKLGDFIHGLVVPSYLHAKTGKKARIFLSNEGCTFTTGITKTYEELAPVLAKQPFVESFELHDGQPVDYNVAHFRNSSLLFKESWTSIYSAIAKEQIPPDYVWLSWPKYPSGSTLVNRSAREMSPNTLSWWKAFLEAEQASFIFSERSQYEAFPLSHLVTPIECKTLFSLVNTIASCSLFIGNQSAPLAIASALGKKRIAELRRNPDAVHYREEKSTNMLTFIGD